MRTIIIAIAAVFFSSLAGCRTHAEPCMEVYLIGTGVPEPQFGNAQASVFLRYGDTESPTPCNEVRLQFDAGRGMLLNLSKVPKKIRGDRHYLWFYEKK
jgi:hypothetical protein